MVGEHIFVPSARINLVFMSKETIGQEPELTDKQREDVARIAHELKVGLDALDKEEEEMREAEKEKRENKIKKVAEEAAEEIIKRRDSGLDEYGEEISQKITREPANK